MSYKKGLGSISHSVFYTFANELNKLLMQTPLDENKRHNDIHDTIKKRGAQQS